MKVWALGFKIRLVLVPLVAPLPHHQPEIYYSPSISSLLQFFTSALKEMTKSKQKRKQQGGTPEGPSKKLKTPATITPPPEKSAVEPKTIQSIGLEQDDLDIAIDTLNALAENPAVIKSKACKDLRTAVYEFRQACTTGFNASGLSLPYFLNTQS